MALRAGSIVQWPLAKHQLAKRLTLEFLHQTLISFNRGDLDPDTAAHIIALLGRTVRERGAAMLLATHSPLAAATADRQLMLTPHGLVPADG